LYNLYIQEEDMASQMIIRIDDETKKKFYACSRREGKSASQKLRELVDNYVRKADISLVVDDLWTRAGAKIRKKGFTEKDVDRIIREVRTAR